jgi:hypothetical protein
MSECAAMVVGKMGNIKDECIVLAYKNERRE